MNEVVRAPVKNFGFAEIEFGEKLSYSPISRFKGKKDKREMVQLLSLKPLAVRYHFEKGIGFHYCYGGACCERGNPLNIRYVFPICVYDTDSRGKIVSENFEIQYFQLGGESYENLVLKYEVNEDLQNRLILVSCNDEKYQRLSMEVAGESPLVKNEAWRNLVMDQYNALKGHIPLAIARVVGSDKEFAALVRKASGEPDPKEAAEFDNRSQSRNAKILEAVVVDVDPAQQSFKEVTGIQEAEAFVDEFADL